MNTQKIKRTLKAQRNAVVAGAVLSLGVALLVKKAELALANNINIAMSTAIHNLGHEKAIIEELNRMTASK